jgi:hypothetical protein
MSTGGSDYSDSRIKLGPDGLRISGYYFPWGTKRIPLDAIHSVRRVDMGFATGRGRIWGTANPRYWANLDHKRPGKRVGFIVDTGHVVRPFVTPDDPDAFESALVAHVGNPVQRGGRSIVI